MKWMLFIAIAAFATACENFELKTRDQLRNSESAPKQKSNSNGVTSQPAAAPAAPPEESLDSQMRTLNGRVDESEHHVQEMNAAIVAAKEDANKQNQLRDQKVAALEEEIKKLETQVQTLNDQVNKPKPVVAADPTTYLSEGDELQTAKKHKEAIVAYQKYRDAVPKGNRYAEATYKIGVSFQELGMKDESKAFYEEVISKHPKSPFAKNAAKKLKSIK